MHMTVGKKTDKRKGKPIFRAKIYLVSPGFAQ